MFATFKWWKAEVEYQTRLKIKCLRSDIGREYDLEESKKFYTDEGIRCTRTVSGKARKNGIDERMNRALNECARSMRLHVELPKVFWKDVVNTTSYLINKGPSIPLGFKIL